MKNRSAALFLPMVVLPVQQGEAVSNGPLSYLIGGIIALLIMGYLIYTLMHPEKF